MKRGLAVMWAAAWLALGGAAHAEVSVARRSAPIDVARQSALIDAVIAGFPAEVSAPSVVAAPPPETAARDGAGPGRVFFLGFAGFGGERVFAEEIKLAAREVGARFGSADQTLLLINDRRDLVTHPLATHENLRYALRALGTIMDRDRDVLFLALSSHGAENGLIEVSNTGLPELGLGAGMLARFLREAGIRWKVVVVSACFSGAFVGPLADDESIVITASARDRPSFGCSDERHLTYFGEAFYRDALPGARSLRDAVASAQLAIREREKHERVTPSEPQSHFGPRLESRLHLAPGAEAMPVGRIPLPTVPPSHCAPRKAGISSRDEQGVAQNPWPRISLPPVTTPRPPPL